MGLRFRYKGVMYELCIRPARNRILLLDLYNKRRYEMTVTQFVRKFGVPVKQ